MPVQRPKCLRNKSTLELGRVSIRNTGLSRMPSLLTVYELEEPVLSAHKELKKILNELSDLEIGNYGIQGIFCLAVARFETMLSDLIFSMLRFFPQKLTLFKKNADFAKDEQKPLSFNMEQFLRGDLMYSVLETEVNKLAYSNLENIANVFSKIYAIEIDEINNNINQLIEIKETRNLLLHNNLLVNEIYLSKTKSIKRSNLLGDKLLIDMDYTLKSVKLILGITSEIIQKIEAKYSKFTLVSLLQGLWSFTFENQGIKLNECFAINEQEDTIDGPFNMPSFLSSSEQHFFEFWQSLRTSTPLSRPSLVHMDSKNVRKQAFLTEVFGELRLTHWQN